MTDTPKTYLSEIQQRDAAWPPWGEMDVRNLVPQDAIDRRWLLGVVNELSAALEITAKCGCSERFTCSRCKALALLSAPAPTEER